MEPKKVSTEFGTRSSRKTVGPATRTNSARKMTSPMFMLLMMRMPVLTPETADHTKRAVRTEMITTTAPLPDRS